ncbi:pyridoxamine 5'-phosphate oxidase family protein [Evansella halocellulosilytica]|uniref:pyridoxamine 5'-phosphate oxidase family protein n=1 Tax=Evansella halocellulosilytica TaxID=2011013 RepID=UPI000BB82AA7|nr:pyridoxamine 5'-phosphate oxidase family protein [Evansella halocellulosilytica]
MKTPFSDVITSHDQLTSYVGEPSNLVKKKVIHTLDVHCQQFIASSPFLVLSTSDANGACDSSPRGDHSGFVQVLDEKRLVIPERPGNKRVDSLKNIIENPSVGLLFFIPGIGETLRVNGKACIIKDQDILDQMTVQGKPPLLGIAVTIEEAFIHCAKAFKRSKLWEPEKWPSTENLASAGRMLKDHASLTDLSEDALNKDLQETYKNHLY